MQTVAAYTGSSPVSCGFLRLSAGLLWASPKLYAHGFTAGALFFPDGYSYSLPVSWPVIATTLFYLTL